MSDISYFESQSGKLKCSAAKAFLFVTDIRNFERFIPNGAITDWKAEKEYCSFRVSMIGDVCIRLTDKEVNSRVVYFGDALKKNDFELALNFSENSNELAVVKITLNADLNPMMKMVAVRPIGQFLEMLITEMEKFTGWDETKQ